MNSYLASILSFSFLPFAVFAAARHLECTGCLGNSGQAGAELVRLLPSLYGEFPSGIAVDEGPTFWVGAGDALLWLGLDGHVIERAPLPRPDLRVDSPSFAKVDNTLYFTARAPGRELLLCRLPLAARPHQTAQVEFKAPADWPRPAEFRIAAEPFEQSLLIGARSGAGKVGLYRFDAEYRTLNQLFTIPGERIESIVYDPSRKAIAVGGILRMPAGMATAARVFDVTGKPLSGDTPRPALAPAAEVLGFKSRLSHAGGALWDVSINGGLARLDMDTRGHPGVVMRYFHSLGDVMQVAELFPKQGGQSPLLLSTRHGDTIHLATWNEAEGFRLLRRFGALPNIMSLGLNADGLVTVSTANSLLWWNWNDSSTTPPFKGDMHSATTTGFFLGDTFVALAAPYANWRSPKPWLVRFDPKLFGRNDSPRYEIPIPARQPSGLCRQRLALSREGWLYLTDGASNQVWRLRVAQEDVRPLSTNWTQLPVLGSELRAPTDLAVLSENRLLLADAGRVSLLVNEGNQLRVIWQTDGQQQTGSPFGQLLHISADHSSLVVSDAARHRVLLFGLPSMIDNLPTFEAQFGETDKAADDAQHLNAPSFISLSGERLVVADSGNQRVLKVMIRLR